jgi:hypothetical protein
MGSELSSCCMSSPLRQNDLDQLDDQIEETDQSESTSNSEELCRRIYDLIVEDQRDELQQLIYDHQIHINEVFWKVVIFLSCLPLTFQIERSDTAPYRCHERTFIDHSNADHQWARSQRCG